MAVTINASTSSGVITTADNSGVLQLQTNSGQTAMTIDTSQNVGIGVTPTYKLDITGANPRMRIQPTTGTEYSLYQAQNTGGSGFIGLENSAGSALSTSAPYSLNLYHTGAYPILFSTSATERMRIDSSGNVLVGTTTTAGAASNNALVVGGVFNSLNGTTALLANGASASIVTSTASLSFYQVFANCIGNTTVFASALIYFNGAGTATVQSIMGTGMSISSSGANIITVTNSAGSSQQISWTVTRYK